MTIHNVEFALKFDSGNQAVVDDPRGATILILQQALTRLQQGETSGTVRDENGNGIGYWVIETEGDDDDTED